MRRHLRTAQWAAAALAVAALAGCDANNAANGGGAAPGSLTGTFTVTVSSGVDDPCAPLSDHPDLVDGATVVVTDGAGATLATGTLGNGRADDDACIRDILGVSMPDVPAFRVTVATYGPIDVTAESLAAAGGVLDLRLGV